MTTTSKPKRYFSEGAVAKSLDTTPNQLISLTKQGILNPLVVESAHAQSRAYDAGDILAMAVARRMRKHKLPLSMIISVCNFLRSKTIDELEAEWEVGRRYLLSVNRCDPLPVLLSHDAIFDNPAIDLKAAATASVEVMLIDVAEAYRELASKIFAFADRKTAEHAKRLAESPFACGRRERFLRERAKRGAKNP